MTEIDLIKYYIVSQQKWYLDIRGGKGMTDKDKTIINNPEYQEIMTALTIAREKNYYITDTELFTDINFSKENIETCLQGKIDDD